MLNKPEMLNGGKASRPRCKAGPPCDGVSIRVIRAIQVLIEKLDQEMPGQGAIPDAEQPEMLNGGKASRPRAARSSLNPRESGKASRRMELERAVALAVSIRVKAVRPPDSITQSTT